MGTNENRTRHHYMTVNDTCPVLCANGRNLNMLFLEGKLDPCYHRDDTIRLIQRVLLRKSKANVMLTGPAGCGKTAIVEGLAGAITMSRLGYLQDRLRAERKNRKAQMKWDRAGAVGPAPVPVEPPKPPLCDCVIYELSLNSMLSGTKYRGEFEQKVQEVIDECKKNPNVILFIDELHQFCTTGAAEGALSAAQILKPALARGDVRVIGATTTEEKQEILRDKALARRFSEVEVRELRSDAARETAARILRDYCAYHNVKTTVSAVNLLGYVRLHLPETTFPDNYINVVDETLAGAVLDGLSTVNMQHFGQTLSRMTGRIILCAEETGTAQAS